MLVACSKGAVNLELRRELQVPAKVWSQFDGARWSCAWLNIVRKCEICREGFCCNTHGAHLFLRIVYNGATTGKGYPRREQLPGSHGATCQGGVE